MAADDNHAHVGLVHIRDLRTGMLTNVYKDCSDTYLQHPDGTYRSYKHTLFLDFSRNPYNELPDTTPVIQHKIWIHHADV